MYSLEKNSDATVVATDVNDRYRGFLTSPPANLCSRCRGNDVASVRLMGNRMRARARFPLSLMRMGFAGCCLVFLRWHLRDSVAFCF